MGRTAIIVALGIVLVFGVGYTVLDYRTWRYEETKNFGHGPGDNAPKTTLPELSQIYRNDVVRLRLRIPEGWTVKSNPKFDLVDPEKPPVMANLVAFEKREEVVKFGDRISISVQRTRANFPDLVAKDAGDIKDWSYVNNGRITITVVRFANKTMAYTNRDDYVYIITWTGVDDGTFIEILKTVAVT